METGPEASSYLVPFLLAAAVAAAALSAVAWLLARRATELRRIRAALGTLGGDHADPVRGARKAADEAARLDTALSELRAILEHAPAGIIAIDGLDRIITINPAAAGLLGTEGRPAEGRLLGEIARSPELASLIAQARAAARSAESELELSSEAGMHRAGCTVVPLSDAVGSAQLLLVLEDRTELRRLEALRTEFVANVSHELRTPITSIRGYAETLVESFELQPEAARFARTILRSSARLGAIIDDLLLLSGLEEPSARESITTSPVRLAGVVAEAVEQATAGARDKGITIEPHIDPCLWVNGNAGLLAHAVGNLVSNAVKYGPSDSVVRVDAAAEGDAAVIAVTDRGPGIPEVHRARLFERFYRVDRARSRESGGTGLGLAIVKHVAQVHGGSVSVESRTDSQHGSTFRIRLPLVVESTARNFPLPEAGPNDRGESRRTA
ncbi:MAG: PAS domain-containing protein [Planctomycetes bacterium]|nr:PAS domain-containing protein [Planctomycetota bacterium]